MVYAFLIVLILLVVLFAFLFFIGKWLKKKGYPNLARILLAALTVFIVYQIYTSIYPRDEFFVEEFESNTSLPFPKSGSILRKEASFPDQHGHYISMAVIHLSEQDYNDLYQKLSVDSIFKIDIAQYPFSVNFLHFIEGMDFGYSEKSTIIFKGTKKKPIRIGFLKDHKTIVFEKGNS